MPTDTPVWDAMNGDAEWDRLRQEWKQARIKADIALAQHGPWEDFLRIGNSRTGRGVDVLIPPQPRRDSRLRKITMDEAGELS